VNKKTGPTGSTGRTGPASLARALTKYGEHISFSHTFTGVWMKVLQWCARVEPGEDWIEWDSFANKYGQKANTDPSLVDYVWYDFGFETAKLRREFVKDFHEAYPKMGKFGQICLYREIEG